MQAIIDIGTNSTLLLIAEKSGGSVRIIEDIAIVTKLGEGLSKSGLISDIASKRTLNALAEYQRLCTDHSAEEIIVLGTAALRNAKNARDFCLIVKKKLGLEVEIISGEEEARLTFAASSQDFGDNIRVVDIGGGSTEVIEGGKDGEVKCESLPIGCLNLTEQFLKNDSPSEDEINNLRTTIRKELNDSQFGFHNSRLIATAGTATTLMAMKLKLRKYDRDTVHGKILSVDWLHDTILDLKSKTAGERKLIVGLPADRADVITAGAIILDEVAQRFGENEILISDAGIRWGILYRRFL